MVTKATLYGNNVHIDDEQADYIHFDIYEKENTRFDDID